jgi:type VI secretion system secreted protein Hcp
MAVDMYLKLASVGGESTDSGHAGEIDLLSWSFAANQTGTSHTGGGSGAGRVSIQDLTITKKVDKASPTLFALCCKGNHLASGTLTVRKAGGDSAVEYLVVKMEHVLITGFQTTGSDGQDQLVEQVSLNFKKVGLIYTPQLDDGTGGPSVGGGWDVGANIAWEPPPS